MSTSTQNIHHVNAVNSYHRTLVTSALCSAHKNHHLVILDSNLKISQLWSYTHITSGSIQLVNSSHFVDLTLQWLTAVKIQVSETMLSLKFMFMEHCEIAPKLCCCKLLLCCRREEMCDLGHWIYSYRLLRHSHTYHFTYSLKTL